MNGKSKYRAATIAVAIVLLLGGLGILSASLSAAQPKVIQGEVTEEASGTLLEGVAVTLIDAHGQRSPESTQTGSDGVYTFSGSASGFYYITVSQGGYFDNRTNIFRFDGTANLFLDIQMEKLPAMTNTLVVHVEDTGGSPVTDATVGVYNVTAEREQLLNELVTNITGNATFSVWSGDFELRVFNGTSDMEIVPISVPPTTHIVVLNDGMEVFGRAVDPEGLSVTDGLVAYLYNTDGVPEPKRLLAANINSSRFTFYAYPGNFILIVDANGKAANITQISISAPGRVLPNRVLMESPEERVDIRMEYGQADWNEVYLRRALGLNRDSGILGLPFSDLRHLRLQIDVALGDGDGVLSQTEIDDFRDWLLEIGPKFVDTQGLFSTSSQFYRSDLINGTTDFNVSVDLSGTGPASITGHTNYTVVGSSIEPGEAEYFVNLTGSHDTSETVYINHTFTVAVVPGYERTLTETTGSVDISGFTSILVDPLLDVGTFEAVITLEPSLNGTARVQVTGPGGRFTELNVSFDNYTVVIPTDENITFSAEESTDPNTPDGMVSPDSNFTWVFENVSRVETAYGIAPKVTFSVMGNYTGNLTIIETGGNQTYRNFTVFVDGRTPEAIIENNVTGLGINANNQNITIPEGSAVTFFGGNSTDSIHTEMEGEVTEWRWDLDGDGEVDTTGETVEWTYSDPGSFTVNLTAIDLAGHESLNATMSVFVEDKTPPEVVFVIRDEDGTEAVSIIEGQLYTFDASDTTDNLDKLEDLTFEWTFGDGGEASGSYNVTHSYEEFGVYNPILNVTDRAGNVGNSTRELVVEVDAPTRPDLEIEAGSLVVEPRNPEESSIFGTVTVTIRLNVTNKEDRARAEDLRVEFWAFRFGGVPGTPTSPPFKLLDENGVEVTTQAIDPGQTRTIEFTWVTGPQGNYTLRVNVTDVREPDIFIGSRNSAETQIDVRQAFWVTPAIIAAAVGVVGGIPTFIYLRRRFRGRLRERITRK